MGDLYGGTWTSGDSNVWTNTITIDSTPYISGNLDLSAYFAPSKPKTNLDWLDERVNEMRVKL